MKITAALKAHDLLVHAIADRFDEPRYRTCSSLQALILKAARKEDFIEELKTVPCMGQMCM